MMSKGVWLWKLQNCEGGKVTDIVAKAQRAGLTRIAVKIADGRAAYNDTPKLRALSLACKLAGIDCWGWGWSYGGSEERAREEANMAGHRCLGLQLRGYVIDAEVQYETKTKKSEVWAAAHCERLRAILGSVPLGMTSYWSPRYHPAIPWHAFADYIDYWWPQVYWHKRDPVETLAASLAELAPYGREVIPLGAADPGDGCPSATQLRAFCAGVDARTDLYHGADFYQWSAIPGANWTVIRDWKG